jgi:hypothetical protein
LPSQDPPKPSGEAIQGVEEWEVGEILARVFLLFLIAAPTSSTPSSTPSSSSSSSSSKSLSGLSRARLRRTLLGRRLRNAPLLGRCGGGSGEGGDSGGDGASDDGVDVDRGGGSSSRGPTKGDSELTHLHASAASLTMGGGHYRQELKILVLCSRHLHNLSSRLSGVSDVLTGILDVLRGSSQFGPLPNVNGRSKGGKLLRDELQDLQQVNTVPIWRQT